MKKTSQNRSEEIPVLTMKGILRAYETAEQVYAEAMGLLEDAKFLSGVKNTSEVAISLKRDTSGARA